MSQNEIDSNNEIDIVHNTDFLVQKMLGNATVINYLVELHPHTLLMQLKFEFTISTTNHTDS